MESNTLIALLPRLLDRCSLEEAEQIVDYLVCDWIEKRSLFEIAQAVGKREETIKLINSKLEGLKIRTLREVPKLEDYRLVVIGFEHLDKADARPSDVWAMDGEFGYLLRIPGDEEESDLFRLISDFSFIESLPPVIEWAKSLGYNYVMFDRDGGKVDGLPLYDWSSDEL